MLEMRKFALVFIFLIFWGCMPNRPFDLDQMTPVPVKQSYISLQCNTLIVSRTGSAIIIKNGYAITNRHVVEGAQRVTAHMAGGIKFPISKIFLSKRLDLALLKIPQKTGKPIAIGKRIKTGERVFSAGTTFTSTILEGIVRETEFMIHHQDVNIPEPGLRDDEGRPMILCLIYEGDLKKGFSGGPIVNERGELVGINQGYITGFMNIPKKTWIDESKKYGIGYHMEDISQEIDDMLARSRE